MQYRHLLVTLTVALGAATASAGPITQAQRDAAELAAINKRIACEKAKLTAPGPFVVRVTPDSLYNYYEHMRIKNDARHSTALNIMWRADCTKRLYY